MARFDVCANRYGAGYLLDVQADLLEHLNTRIVVPLLARDQAPKPATRLNPVFRINGADHVMVTQFMAAVPAAEIGPVVTSLEERFETITVALDMAFQGF